MLNALGGGRALGALKRMLAAIIRRRESMRDRYLEVSRSESEVRGIKLLKDWLSAEQLSQFRKYGHFEVVGCATGRRYRIRYGLVTNVHELDEQGRAIAGWCFVPNQPLVQGDVMLAQKIALETDELRALAVAKPFRPTWC
jgi:hypothetical protein